MNAKTLLKFLLIVCFGFSGRLMAQPLQAPENYANALIEYQAWLEYKHYNEVLKIVKYEIKLEQLILYLEIPLKSSEDDYTAWRLLKNAVMENDSMQVEHVLLLSMINIFKLTPLQAEIVIADTYEPLQFSYFQLKISADIPNRAIQVEETSHIAKNTNNLTRSVAKSFPIQMNKIALGKGSATIPRFENSREIVFKKILDFSRKYYADKVKNIDDDFSVTSIGDSKILKFEVTNLRQEVLSAEDDIWICGLLNWVKPNFNCDWRKVEYLRFTFSYEKINSTEAKLECIIDARYGSGYYDTTVWEKCISMEPEFTGYLDKYTQKYTERIYNMLITK